MRTGRQFVGLFRLMDRAEQYCKTHNYHDPASDNAVAHAYMAGYRAAMRDVKRAAKKVTP